MADAWKIKIIGIPAFGLLVTEVAFRHVFFFGRITIPAGVSFVQGNPAHVQEDLHFTVIINDFDRLAYMDIRYAVLVHIFAKNDVVVCAVLWL